MCPGLSDGMCSAYPISYSIISEHRTFTRIFHRENMTQKNRYRRFSVCICIVRLFLLFFHVCKFGVLRQPYEIYGSDRAVSLLCDINLCNSLHVAVLVIIVITIDEHYHIGILLNGTGLTQIRKHRTMLRPLFYGTAEL